MHILAERSFPSFYSYKAPKLLKFFSDWLDWTELPGNSQYILNNLATEQDIDESIDAYATHLKSKLIADFPEKLAVDLRLLLKTVLWLYRAKSSRKAYDFLFRVLFNSPAKIWHPRETMLKTSDGRWDVPQYFGVWDEPGCTAFKIVDECLGWMATGESSGATAFIGGMTSYSGKIECLSSEAGEFATGKVYSGYGTPSQRFEDAISASIECDPLAETFRITLSEPAPNLVTASFWVQGAYRTANIEEGGTETVFGGLVFRSVQIRLVRDRGLETECEIEGVSASLSYDFDRKKYIVSIESPLDADVSALVEFNKAYAEAKIKAGETEGVLEGRSFEPSIIYVQGRKTSGIPLDSPSMHFAPGERITLTDPDTGAVSDMHPLVAWHAEADGHYTSTKGFLSDINAIQDNYYWQTYSYVVQSYVSIKEWRRIVKRILHPAGLEVFGEILVEGSLEPGHGIMEMPMQEFLRKFKVFYRRMADLSRQALYETRFSLSSCMLAQTHSITSDLWLQWIDAKEQADAYASYLRGILYGTEDSEADRDAYDERLDEFERGCVLAELSGDALDTAYNLLACAELILQAEVASEEDIEWASDVADLFENSLREGAFDIVYETLDETEEGTFTVKHRLHESAADALEVLRDLLAGHFIGRHIEEDERAELQAVLSKLKDEQSLPWKEDLRDWFDIRPSDVECLLNANSVLFFRSDGTLIDPQIVDWVDFSFTGCIDLPFEFRGETVAPKTEYIIGTTLHPDYPMIHGTIEGNEFAVPEGKEFIPNLHLVFVGSTHPASGVKVRILDVQNEVLQYQDIDNPSFVDDAEIRGLTVEDLARRFNLQSQTASLNGIVPWRELVIDDFIYTSRDSGLVFNSNSLLKVPDAWVSEDREERKYVFERNAWEAEKISVVSYSPFDFSYRIWLERVNGAIVCRYTVYGTDTAPSECLLKNSNLCIVKPERGEDAASSVPALDHTEEVVLAASVPSGWGAAPQDVYMATSEWKLAYKDPNRQSSWFEFKLPEPVEPERILCFVNGRLQSGGLHLQDGSISVDTIEDNGNVVYSSKYWDLMDLSLFEWVLDDNGEHVIVDDEESPWNGKWEMKPVMVSINESDTIAFKEATLQDRFVLNEEMKTVSFGDLTMEEAVANIVSCSISTALSFTEIYVLAPIEASRKLKYPWYPNPIEGESGIVWPFTYDNVRLFPFAPHGISVTWRSGAEIVVEKETQLPEKTSEVQWRKVQELEADFIRTFVAESIVPAQRQSETVDRILQEWWDYAPRSVHMDFAKNDLWEASANASSTLLFDEDGVLAAAFDWGVCDGFGEGGVGLPRKWWSVPVLADLPAEHSQIENGRIASESGLFKETNALVFADGLKVLDADVRREGTDYIVEGADEGAQADVYSMGETWLAGRNGSWGYYAARRNGSSWTQWLRGDDGLPEESGSIDSLSEFDITELIGISMNRSFGAVWPEEGSGIAEIKGTTEVAFRNGDKRRFVDLSFLALVDVAAPAESMRLYEVANSRPFGIVEHIADIDPRFILVFVDGRYAPMNSGKWRYLKGTFFIETEPEESIEIYIANPMSYLVHDSALAAPEGIGALAFDNLRENQVPRHMLTAIDRKAFHLQEGFLMTVKDEIQWRRVEDAGRNLSLLLEGTVKTFHSMAFSLGFRKMRLQALERISVQLAAMALADFASVSWRRVAFAQAVEMEKGFLARIRHTARKMSETPDEIIARQQMDPSAWTNIDVDMPAKTGRNSMMMFTPDGRLADPLDVDYVSGTFRSKMSETVVEILTPESAAQMARVYMPLYEVDPEAHSGEYIDSRYPNLEETEPYAVDVNGTLQDIERHMAKIVADFHNEEEPFIKIREDMSFDNGRYSSLISAEAYDPTPEIPMPTERLLLTDIISDFLALAVDGDAMGVYVDAERPIFREVQLVREDGIFRTAVPSLFGCLVYIDGEKQKEGTFLKQAWVDGILAASSASLSIDDVPEDADLFTMEFADQKWRDDEDHCVVLYWPKNGWAGYVSEGSVAGAVRSSIQSSWQEYGFETFKDYVHSRFLLFCSGTAKVLDASADGSIRVDGVPIEDIECQDFELYVIDVASPASRTAVFHVTSTEQQICLDNLAVNWFAEHKGTVASFRELGLPSGTEGSAFSISASLEAHMEQMSASSLLSSSSWTVTANNRDMFDNVFARGSVPVRSFVNPSLYVERRTKVNLEDFDGRVWKLLGEGEDAGEIEFVRIDANALGYEDDSLPAMLVTEPLSDDWDGLFYWKADYVPETWDIQVYSTSRENPEAFWPAERVPQSDWQFYSGWNSRLVFFNAEEGKDIWIVETLDRSMDGSIANTDWVYWLEKEFNRKSTMVFDSAGLIVAPDGLDWINGEFVFPHEGRWTAQPEDAGFPCIQSEVVPDTLKKRLIMDLCLDDNVGYDSAVGEVADASIDSLVYTASRMDTEVPWSSLANRDWIYWEEGEFRNWVAWLAEDDVFFEDKCFVFMNGRKVPDGQWAWDGGERAVQFPNTVASEEYRCEFLPKEIVEDEWIVEEEISKPVIDPERRILGDYTEEGRADVIIDAMWTTWKMDGAIGRGEKEDIPDGAYVVARRPNPKECLIWPVSRIVYRFYTDAIRAAGDEGILLPEYLGHDLSKYVMAFADGRQVQCVFDGNRFTVPEWDSAEVLEAYVFELNDETWINRFKADESTFVLENFRDMRVC